MKHIPNILSFSRILLSLSLIYVATLRKPLLFVCLYAATALTDTFDGFLARRYHWESKLGSKIDGFADMTLVLSMLFIVFLVLKLHFKPYVVGCVVAMVLVRVVNLLFTKIKFKQWGTLHSFLLRYGSIPIFLLPPLLVWTGKANNVIVLFVLIISLASVLEEFLIIAVMKEYDMNTKSVWHARKQNQAAQSA
jgi:phosphatidylglycerophosphate synthase